MLFKHDLKVWGSLCLAKVINLLTLAYFSRTDLYLLRFSLSFEFSMFILWTLYLWSGIRETILFIGDDMGVFYEVTGKIIG